MDLRRGPGREGLEGKGKMIRDMQCLADFSRRWKKEMQAYHGAVEGDRDLETAFCGIFYTTPSVFGESDEVGRLGTAARLAGGEGDGAKWQRHVEEGFRRRPPGDCDGSCR